MQLPNNKLIAATIEGELPLSEHLSSTAKKAMVLPKLKCSNLILIGQLCDDEYSIILDKKKTIAFKNNKVILKGIRNKTDDLWDIPIPKTNITKDYCTTPTTHPSMHGARQI